MKPLVSYLWRWSWVATVPLAIVFLHWIDQTWDRYWTFGIRYDSAPLEIGLLDTGEHEANHIINRSIFEIFGKGGRSSIGSNDLRLINLFINEGQLAKLNRNLPHSGFQEVKGRIWQGNEPINCKLRYRGDYAPHWAYAKKSWRVKTSQNKLFEGIRKFNLVSPKYPAQICNYFGYKLAKAMGLIAPKCEMVQVAVNGKLQGVHLLVEQIEELTLRQNGYMPGDLYRGELVAKDAFIGAYKNSVFEHPELWDKVATNNHYALESKAPLEKFMRLCVAPPSESTQNELLTMLDVDAWARFSVYEALTQCFHFDEAHNWRLFYDANRIRFVPIIWDPIAVQPDWRPQQAGQTLVDVVGSRLHELLYQNAEFLRARHKAMVDFFKDGMDKKYLAIADDIMIRLPHAIENDVNRRPASTKTIAMAAWMMRRSMEHILTDLREAYIERSGSVRFDTIDAGICLEIQGRRPVNQLQIAFRQPLTQVPSVRVRYQMDEQDRDIEVAAACAVSGSKLTLNLGLLAQLVSRVDWNGAPMRNHQKSHLPTYYEIVFPGLPNPHNIREIRCDRGNGSEIVTRDAGKIHKRPIRGLFAAVKSQIQRPALRIGGVIEVSKTQEITSNVVIAAGTRFVMHPGVSIRFWGRVLADGTAEMPIRFEPKSKDQKPWGVVALQGQSTTGSQFRHCQFNLGSGWKDPYFEYSAMFSVHDSSNVRIDDCQFRNSRIVDDMVHTVYSHVEFDRCHFEHSLMDALDMDLCTGKVVNCVFRHAGNDSLDLMTSQVVIDNTSIYDSGDKGISVGENTTLLATRIKLIRCLIGIEGKDSSQAYVMNSLFDSNKKWAINAYKKNWRYGNGGQIAVHYSQFLNTVGGLNADRHSSVLVENSYLDKVIPASGPMHLGKLNDIANGKKDQARKSPPMTMPAALRPIEAMARPHFAKIQRHRRGLE
jgi:hypothetical protein